MQTDVVDSPRADDGPKAPSCPGDVMAIDDERILESAFSGEPFSVASRGCS
jgi:hypothetical protein